MPSSAPSGGGRATLGDAQLSIDVAEPLLRELAPPALLRDGPALAFRSQRPTLSLDLGFSSHSHFTTSFTQAYGRSPSEFRQAVLQRPAGR